MKSGYEATSPWRRATIFLAIACACALSAELAHASQRSWIFSGAELKQAIEGKYAPEVSDPESKRMVSVAKASAYIAGIADMTGGKTWCGAGDIAPHEITDRVYTRLSDLPAEKLNENAADVVSDALAASFPCQTIKN